MNKTLTFLSSTIAALTLTTSLSAAPAATAAAAPAAAPATAAKAGAAIAVLDVNRILTESKAAKGLNTQMETHRVKFETEIAKKEEALRKEEAELTKNQSTMKEAELEKRKKAFEGNVAELQKSIMAQQNMLTNGAQDAMNTIRESVLKIASDIASTEGYDYVQPAASLLFFKPGVDITDKTIARLDKELSEVKVVLKEAPAAPAKA